MPYERLFIGDSVFLFFRAGGGKILVERAVWLPEYVPGMYPKVVDRKEFESEAHLEECFKNLFHVEVTQ